MFVDCDAEECARRDPKGLYAKARATPELKPSGVAAPYEAPEAPELVLRTAQASIEASEAAVLDKLREFSILPLGTA